MAYEIYPTSLVSTTSKNDEVEVSFPSGSTLTFEPYNKRNLYIRIAMSKADCSSSSGSTLPTVSLKAGYGNFTVVPGYIYDNTTPIPQYLVGDATFADRIIVSPA